jgi:hypothetical protein
MRTPTQANETHIDPDGISVSDPVDPEETEPGDEGDVEDEPTIGIGEPVGDDVHEANLVTT